MRKQYLRLTPEKAWERYGNGVSVEFFISDFLSEGYTDLWEMCNRYILEIINGCDGLVTVEERAHVTDIFYRYIKDYVDNQGGMDKLDLWTQEKLDAFWKEASEDFINVIRQITKE